MNWFLLRKARMSETKKQPEGSGNPAAPLEDALVGTEPAVTPTVAQPRSASGATPDPGGASPVTADAAKAGLEQLTPTIPDPLTLGMWNEQVRRRMRHQTRRGFLGLGAGLLAGFGAFEWLTSRREIDGVPWPLRKTLEVKE